MSVCDALWFVFQPVDGLATNVYIGLSVSSHNSNTLCSAVMDNVTLIPRLPSVQGKTVGGEYVVQASVLPNQACMLEVSTNLTDWWPVQTNVAPEGGEVNFAEALEFSAAYRFYRLKF